MDAERRLQ
jgi:hypothetical protein